MGLRVQCPGSWTGNTGQLVRVWAACRSTIRTRGTVVLRLYVAIRCSQCVDVDELIFQVPVNLILLIHWNEAEAEERVHRLRAAGFAPLLFTSARLGAADLRRLLDKPIEATIIDLSRLPSTGRDVGIALRSRKATRHIPIVFVDGHPEKVSRVKAVLPDALFTRWQKIGTAVKSAIKHHTANPLVPNTMAAYSGTPLLKKLGIKPRVVVGLLNAPDAFERTLGSLPDGVLIQEHLRGKTDLVVLFASRMADVYAQFPHAERSIKEGGRLWIAWPKQASGVKTDVTQLNVREFGLAAGWVDFKICAIDEIWSGLAFVRRIAKANRAGVSFSAIEVRIPSRTITVGAK
jgi:hypothetical protein